MLFNSLVVWSGIVRKYGLAAEFYLGRLCPRVVASQTVLPPQCRNGRVKWGTMSDESQAMVKKVGLIGLSGVIMLSFSEMIFPLLLLAGVSYFAWRALFKK